MGEHHIDLWGVLFLDYLTPRPGSRSGDNQESWHHPSISLPGPIPIPPPSTPLFSRSSPIHPAAALLGQMVLLLLSLFADEMPRQIGRVNGRWVRHNSQFACSLCDHQPIALTSRRNGTCTVAPSPWACSSTVQQTGNHVCVCVRVPGAVPPLNPDDGRQTRNPVSISPPPI